MTRRFSALVLQDTPLIPDPEQFANVLSTRFLEGESVAAPEDLAEDGLFVLEIAGRLIAVERLEGPMPHVPLGSPVQPERPFPAREVIEGHAAHLRVADLEEPEDAAGARESARLVTVVAGVLGRMTKARGAFYPQSGAVLPENEALRAAHTLHSGVSPIEAWATFYPLGPNDDGAGTVHGCCTRGLLALIGREIEVAPVPITRRKALDRAYGAVWRALDGEDPLEDDQELRDSEDTVIARVRAARQWLREGVPAWVLVGPEAVIDEKRLRLRRGVDPAILTTPLRPGAAADAPASEETA